MLVCLEVVPTNRRWTYSSAGHPCRVFRLERAPFMRHDGAAGSAASSRVRETGDKARAYRVHCHELRPICATAQSLFIAPSSRNSLTVHRSSCNPLFLLRAPLATCSALVSQRAHRAMCLLSHRAHREAYSTLLVVGYTVYAHGTGPASHSSLCWLFGSLFKTSQS